MCQWHIAPTGAGTQRSDIIRQTNAAKTTMQYNYTFTYRKCQDCSAKVRCSDCDADLTASIDDIPQTRAVLVSTKQKLLTVESELDEMDLLDEMEVVGIFADC